MNSQFGLLFILVLVALAKRTNSRPFSPEEINSSKPGLRDYVNGYIPQPTRKSTRMPHHTKEIEQLAEKMSKLELEEEMEGHAVAQGKLMATFSKNGTVNK